MILTLWVCRVMPLEGLRIFTFNCITWTFVPVCRHVEYIILPAQAVYNIVQHVPLNSSYTWNSTSFKTSENAFERYIDFSKSMERKRWTTWVPVSLIYVGNTAKVFFNKISSKQFIINVTETLKSGNLSEKILSKWVTSFLFDKH